MNRRGRDRVGMHAGVLLIGLGVVTAAIVAGGEAMKDADIPINPPEGAALVPAAEIHHMLDWTGRAFTGRVRAGLPPRVELEVVRQDHNVLGFGKSCMETPIVIGQQAFTHGLGTHANSEIVAKVPPGAKTFKAFVGIDNNYDTQGARGSVVFSVEIGGKELFHTPVVRSGDAPVAVSVDLPAGTERVTLKVDTTPDGPSHDQADWADAQFVLEDGRVCWLDDNQNPILFLGADPPFSFVYDGKPSSEFLKMWKREVESKDQDDRVVETVRWTDPATGLCVRVEATTYKRFAAADWVIWFENHGGKDTPIIEDIQALDASLRTGVFRNPATIHQLEGDSCGENSFLPKAATLEAGKRYGLAPTGGRSSSISAFPFFNVQYGDRGLIAAVGWSGQWQAQFDRAANGPTRLRAGLEKTHLLLHPGEQIRTPRIVVMSWQGDRTAAHNAWRRLVLFHYVPRIDGRPARLPVAFQTFDRYNSAPGWATEAGQIEAVELAHKLGCDTYWLDAAWFPGNFPNGVGNWFCKPDAFPNGLKPVSDAAHKYGMKFVLWFEPERVAPNTQIANEHPEFVFGGKNGGLFKLNDPAARRWLTELLSQRITEYGIDIYRNDFNMDPLSFWRDNDAADRQGMNEIQYVMGLYEMWDELRARHPGLIIDNCSSGGRRIDIETCSRSVPLWRSDTNCFSGHSEWKQAQTMGIGLYVPLHTATAWVPEPYDVRSATTGGLLCQFAYREPGFLVERAAALIAEAKENQKYWYGDFYPLTPCTHAPDHFCAYQFHRADLDAGLVLAFRRPECNYFGLILGLNGINPDAAYNVEFVDDAGKKSTQTMAGTDLATNLPLRLPEKGSTLIVRYERSKP